MGKWNNYCALKVPHGAPSPRKIILEVLDASPGECMSRQNLVTVLAYRTRIDESDIEFHIDAVLHSMVKDNEIKRGFMEGYFMSSYMSGVILDKNREWWPI